MDLINSTKSLALAAIAALAVVSTGCSTDNATQINYGVYASPDLLAIATPVVTVTNSDGKTSEWTLDATDFKISPDLHITAGNQGMLYWATGEHFDKFGVESTITVTYKLKDGVASQLTGYEGTLTLGHGIVGNVITQNTDGDFYDKPIYQATSAEVFTLPADASAAQTYLIDLSQSPDEVSVTVDASGVPTVKFNNQ